MGLVPATAGGMRLAKGEQNYVFPKAAVWVKLVDNDAAMKGSVVEAVGPWLPAPP